MGGPVTIYDITAHRPTGHVPGNDVRHVTFSGTRLLIQRESGSLEVWDQRGSSLARVIGGDKNYWWAPIADQFGKFVARQRLDGTIELVDLDSGALIDSIPSSAARGAKTSVVLSPDGKAVITLSDSAESPPSGKLIMRDISPQSLIRTACTAAGSNLSSDEWLRIVGGEVAYDPPCR